MPNLIGERGSIGTRLIHTHRADTGKLPPARIGCAVRISWATEPDSSLASYRSETVAADLLEEIFNSQPQIQRAQRDRAADDDREWREPLD